MFLYINGLVNGAIKYFFLKLQCFYPVYLYAICHIISSSVEATAQYKNRAMYYSEFSQPAQKKKKAEEEDLASCVENVEDETHLDNSVKDYVNEYERIEAL